MSSPKYAFKPMIGSILRASDKLIEKLIISGKPIKKANITPRIKRTAQKILYL